MEAQKSHHFRSWELPVSTLDYRFLLWKKEKVVIKLAIKDHII